VNTAPMAGVGSALMFNGVNSAVEVNSAVIGNKGNFTVEAWVSALNNAGPRTLFAQGAGSNLFSLTVAAGGQIQVSGAWDTGVPLPSDGWHHLAMVKETSNARLYI